MRTARWRSLSAKSEYRISKLETNTKTQKIKIQNRFEHLKIGILKIVSGFGFRVSNLGVFGATLLLLIISYLLFAAPPVSAQTATNYYNAPNYDPGVPRNQHTYAQSVTIEVISAVICQIAGIDIINPEQGCLVINPETRKLSLAPPPEDQHQLGGALNATVGMISALYTPMITTIDYTGYIASNFGVVKEAHAQSYGFDGLRPILGLWVAVRNVAYILLVLAFVFIGIGVMMRIKIDPRTVMTIQNQIPKVIISIILITFSYAIAAILVDLTWTTTYAGVYLLTEDHNPDVGDCRDKADGPESLSTKATESFLQTPITFFNQVFARCSDEDNPLWNENDRDGGFHIVTLGVSGMVGSLVGDMAESLFFSSNDLNEGCGWLSIGCKAKQVGVKFLSVIISAVVAIVVFVILVINLFKIWFMLLKAYIYTLFYIILAPVYIVFGLLPSKPLGFEKWIRALFVNLAIFPVTAYAFVGARLLMDIYDTSAPDRYIPPLVGNPLANFGTLLAFGAIMMIPNLQKILQDKMGVKGVGSPGLIAAGIAGGASVVGAPVKRAVQHLNRNDIRTGDVGMLARMRQNVGTNAIKTAGRVPIFRKSAEKKLSMQEELMTKGHLHDYNKTRLDEKKAKGDSKSASSGPGTQRKRWKRGGRKKNGGGDDGSGTPPPPPPRDPDREGGYL